MFSFFERLLKPTETPERPEPPATLIGFFWHYAQQAKGLFAALFVAGFVVALLDTLDSDLHRPRGHADHDQHAANAVRRALAAAAHDGGHAAGGAAARAHHAEPAHQSGDLGQRLQSYPLAESLACGAPVLGVLSERLRRADRKSRDADRTGDPRDRGRSDHRRLVHPRLRHECAHPAGIRRSLAGLAGDCLVRRATSSCCAFWCRACATARRRCRKRARR